MSIDVVGSGPDVARLEVVVQQQAEWGGHGNLLDVGNARLVRPHAVVGA